MKILLLSLIFEPDVCSGSYIFSDLATEFVKMGHEVKVITTTPHYDEKNAFEKRKLLTKTKYKWLYKSNYNGAEVFHINVKPKKGNIIDRFVTFYKLQTKALKIAKKLKLDADVIYSQTPPMTIGMYANKIARLIGCKSVNILQDLWVDAVYRKKKISKFLYRILLKIEKKILLKSSVITTLSDEMKQVVDSKTSHKKAAFVIPNFVNTSIYKPLTKNYRREFGFTDEDFIISYVGNIGKAQDLTPLLDIAKIDQKIKIVIAGNGALENYYKEICKNESIKNVKFLGYVSRDESVKINSISDMCSIMLANHVTSTSFPSKVYTIMACGKPILLSCNQESSIANFVKNNQIGMLFDKEELLKIFKSRDYSKLYKYGQNGLKLSAEKYTCSVVAKQYLDVVRLWKKTF